MLKFLELAQNVSPDALHDMLEQNHFSYANVPYKLVGFEETVQNSKDTVTYDHDLANLIERRVESMGADGKLILGYDESVYQVSLTEKLLVPMLAKLSNLVLEGGSWLNTQRPEWNDANNALVGQGLSVVTLCYLYRYLEFLNGLFDRLSDQVELSNEVAEWLQETSSSLRGAASRIANSDIDDEYRFEVLSDLGSAASRYRDRIYSQQGFSGRTSVSSDRLRELVDNALKVVYPSLRSNRREDGLYHSYNTLNIHAGHAKVNALYPMLEGQVAILSSGVLSAAESVDVLEALYASDIYRPDQKTFMLYPDRQPGSFLDKNHISTEKWSAISLLRAMAEQGDERICEVDTQGNAHFNAELNSAAELGQVLNNLENDYGHLVSGCSADLFELYEELFQHHSFTGRSGGMFGFEGLGCVYWHMVGKLLLATQESWLRAVEQNESEKNCNALARYYYRVRDGMGSIKSRKSTAPFPWTLIRTHLGMSAPNNRV